MVRPFKYLAIALWGKTFWFTKQVILDTAHHKMNTAMPLVYQ
ncbi:hypothetical protein [Nostoc favosum]|nr:hypothetical protein [Nostoc favosum]